MTDIELPLKKRTRVYRFFEILPGAMSIGAILLLVLFSLFNPVLAALYILILVVIMFVRAIATAYRTLQGRVVMDKTSKVNWAERLAELGAPAKALKKYQGLDLKKLKKDYLISEHLDNLKNIKDSDRSVYPRPRQIINVDLIAFYNEGYDVLGPTLENLANSDYDIENNLVIFIAYEERGGEKALETIKQIKANYTGVFRDLVFVKHPVGLPDEVVGKGPNISYAGPEVVKWCKKNCIDLKNVIVTTQDSDNKPDKQYFSYLTYNWIVEPERQQASFQPICLFDNNIWDALAPMRVVAWSNSFWNVISSMRPHLLRNFASHSQGLWALNEMNFWSRRTIVEDGHQYWRSYFFFDGKYKVVPLRLSIGQDAVMSSTYLKTLKAQFIQMRRWAYGASDVAYVATNLMRKDFKGNKVIGWLRFWQLLEGTVSLACMAPIIAFGAFAPIYINPEAAHLSIVANDLPLIVSRIQQVAIVGLAMTVLASLTMLPRRPKRYRASKSIWMVVQWVLMPVNAIVYSSASAYTAQIKLMLGRYMNKFDVTEKASKLVKKK